MPPLFGRPRPPGNSIQGGGATALAFLYVVHQQRVQPGLARPLQGQSARAVEFHIRGGRAGTRDLGAAITVEIRDLAVRSRDAAAVENVARPSATGLVVSGEDVQLKTLAAEPGDDF